MSIDDRGRTAGQRTVATFEASTNVDHDYDRLVDRRRSRRRNRTVALATALVVAVFAVFFVQSNFSAASDPQPMEPAPGLEIGDVPVWYDDAGLHRGDVVEQTSVELQGRVGDASYAGVLALVRTGALYLDPATGDVWFHPWGGDPRIVGHNSTTGPGGDPNGDTAAWLEGTELVVYDTAAGRELSRTVLLSGSRPFAPGSSGKEHFPTGNGFLQVSADRLVWKFQWGASTYFYDLRTGTDLVDGNWLVDVHDDAAVATAAHLVLGMPGQANVRYPELEDVGRFSPSGDYVLAVGDSGTHESQGAVIRTHDAVIIDAATGDLWPVPRRIDYPWIAWSYGDIAMVNFDHRQGKLLACDAARRTCESLTVEGDILMPTT